jgi:hypothetical protein
MSTFFLYLGHCNRSAPVHTQTGAAFLYQVQLLARTRKANIKITLVCSVLLMRIRIGFGRLDPDPGDKNDPQKKKEVTKCIP